jgi:diguanylate cyclase (GGDEF)-like protein
MREARSLAEGWRRILLPSVAAAFLPFVVLWLPGTHWRPVPVIAAAVLTVGLAAIAVGVPTHRRPQWAPCALSFGYLLAYLLLRIAGGPSGVAPMVLLPVFWLGLYGTSRQLWSLLAAIALVSLGPLALAAGPTYPGASWRAAVLFIAVSAVVGGTVHALVAHVRAQDRERDRLLEQLNVMAHADPLTGIANRRAWEAELERGLARGRRTGEPVSVALLDIDSFKAVNDVYGHSGGDSLLIELARVWTESLRPDDILARIGGDEFAVLMPGCTEHEAGDVVDRLRVSMPSPHSCSVGLATWDRAEPAHRLIGRADAGLYDAKRTGRAGAAPALVG